MTVASTSPRSSSLLLLFLCAGACCGRPRPSTAAATESGAPQHRKLRDAEFSFGYGHKVQHGSNPLQQSYQSQYSGGSQIQLPVTEYSFGGRGQEQQQQLQFSEPQDGAAAPGNPQLQQQSEQVGGTHELRHNDNYGHQYAGHHFYAAAGVAADDYNGPQPLRELVLPYAIEKPARVEVQEKKPTPYPVEVYEPRPYPAEKMVPVDKPYPVYAGMRVAPVVKRVPVPYDVRYRNVPYPVMKPVRTPDVKTDQHLAGVPRPLRLYGGRRGAEPWREVRPEKFTQRDAVAGLGGGWRLHRRRQDDGAAVVVHGSSPRE